MSRLVRPRGRCGTSWSAMIRSPPLGVALALGATALIAGAGAPAWWVMPVAAGALLALSLRRAAR